MKSRLTPQERKYFQMWRNVCTAKGWKQGDDCKRHAVHILALGEDKTHKAFTNRDWDRVYNALKTLADSDDLDALIEQNAYELRDQAAHSPVVNPGKKTRKSNRNRAWASRYEHIPTGDDPGERRRLVWFISRLFEESLAVSICRDLFDKADWRALEIPALTQLRDTLNDRLEKFIGNVRAGRIAHDFGFPIFNEHTGRPRAIKTILRAIAETGLPSPIRMSAAPQRPPVFICAPEGILINATTTGEDPF